MLSFKQYITESKIDFEQFKKHWKKKPSAYDYNLSKPEEHARYYKDYFEHIEKKYGPLPQKVKKSISTAGFKSNPVITYKGEKFPLKTGMDEYELMYHVYTTNG